MTDLRENPDVKTGITLTLVQMLYDRKVSISEFKEYCTKNGIDYESVEHCCGCAGCYDPTDSSICPDFDYYHLPRKIIEPKYCSICGQGANAGFPFEDKNGKVVFTFWTCPAHASDKKLEGHFRRMDYKKVEQMITITNFKMIKSHLLPYFRPLLQRLHSELRRR